MIAVHDAAKSLSRRKRAAIARIDVADLALGNHDQRLFVDAVLPGEESRVETAAEKLGLKSGLTLQRDDSALVKDPGRDQNFSTMPTLLWGM